MFKLSTDTEKLREKAVKEGKFEDDFTEKSPYWDWRIDNFAGYEVKDSILRMYMGPTEALFYSNVEISDGDFYELPWRFKTFEAKIRLQGKPYGSAGWGFWNYTMVIDNCQPIWFIHLMSRGPYPFQGFFAQVGHGFVPIVIYKPNFQLKAAYYVSKISENIANVKIYTLKPTMQDLNVEEWHVYKVDWKEKVKFYIDDKLVATIPFKGGDAKARADIWIDNAVYSWSKNDAGNVYRHVTQENRRRYFLEVDYVKVY